MTAGRAACALAVALACAGVAAGCGWQPLSHRASEAREPATHACKAADVQFVIGKTVDQRLGEEARGAANAEWVQVLRPGDAPSTLRPAANRLTLRTDAQGVVTAVTCG